MNLSGDAQTICDIAGDLLASHFEYVRNEADLFRRYVKLYTGKHI